MLTAVLAVLAVMAASLAFAVGASAHGDDHQRVEVAKVAICHHNEGHGGDYTSNNVSVWSVNNRYELDFNGHGNHADDIIPVITHEGVTLFSPARGDQRILAHGCQVPAPTLYAGTAAYPMIWVCEADAKVSVGPIAAPYTTPRTYTLQSDADAAARDYVAANTVTATAAFMAAHSAYRDVPASGSCTRFSETVRAEASTWICLVETGPTLVTALGTGVPIGPQTEPISDAQRTLARTQDQSSADAALTALLATAAYEGFTLTTSTGTCTVADDPPSEPADPPTTPADPPTEPTTVTPVEAAVVTVPEPATVAVPEPATVAVPEPATVAVPEPATVAVPAAATALPTTVPAGDGSRIPATPIWVLAVLALGGAALAAASLRLAGQRLG